MADDATPRSVEESGVSAAALSALLDRQQRAFLAEPFASLQTRKERLKRVVSMLETHEDDFLEAVNADFGGRSKHETILAEILMTLSAARDALKHVSAWMRPRRAPAPLYLAPAKARIAPQPLGVVGVISPWNYPLLLTLSPMIAAIAAGNRVMIKPSELTAQTSEALDRAIASAFGETECAVVTGGVDVGKAFSQLPFDHLIFTGSTKIGVDIARAAAENLTPVTLELGGKSPAIIDETADIQAAARSIAYGKLLNAGQTCVAPDYVLAPSSKIDVIIQAMKSSVAKLYPRVEKTRDYSAIISERHYARLERLVDEARQRGADIVPVGDAAQMKARKKLPLTLVINPPKDCTLMQEEIFGPILPIIPISSRDDAIATVNAKPRPLALYWFGRDRAAREAVLTQTHSGGVTINDTLRHAALESLPFGGVGASGMGAYHGKTGFDRLSHLKPIYYQSRFANQSAIHPPYSRHTDKILKFIRKII
ncbi:MAG: coniferyl aldehyde dehydrogenase [Pseudomonadota bacterium]